jgi:hypothetical protein
MAKYGLKIAEDFRGFGTSNRNRIDKVELNKT